MSALDSLSRPVEEAQVELLAGRYEVIQVMLSHGPKPSYWRGHLELAATDTLRRYYVRTLRGYVKRGLRPLAGQYRYAADSLGRSEEAEVEGGVLFLGCRLCADASPDQRLKRAVESRFVRGAAVIARS